MDNSSEKSVPNIRFPYYSDPWEQRKLETVVNSVDTGKSKFDKDGSSGDYAILGSTSVIGYDNEYDYEGDFILTARVGANAGSLYRHAGKVKISDNTVFIQASENIEFLYHLLAQFDVKKLSFGTGQPLVKASELKNLELIMPTDTKEQIKIGECFKSLDNLITLHQRKCDELKIYKKGLLQQMFPKPGEAIPRVRFSGFTDPWEQRKYSEIIDLLSGQDFEPSDYNDNGQGIPYMTGASCVVDGKTIVNRWTTAPRCIAETGDVLLVCKGSGCGTIAVMTQDRAHIARQFMALKSRTELNNQFNYYLLNTVVENIKKDARGLIAGIAREAVLNQKVYVPQIEEQLAIGTFFAGIDTLITLHQRKCDELKTYKNGLLQKMFV